MKILVTGAAGFIGSHLSDALLAMGHDVVGVDNFDPYYDRSIKEANVSPARQHDRFVFHELDLRDKPKTFELIGQNFDLVAHIAARGGVRPSLDDPFAYQSLNVDATMNVLEAMRTHGVNKLLLASTSAVYGNNEKVPFAEDDRVDFPISPYAATKKACELMAHTYHHLYGMNIFCLRFFTVYGPRQRPDMAIHKFTRMIHEGATIKRYGDGTTERDYTYIDDIIQGLTRAVDRVAGYEIINLGENRTVRLNTLLDLLQTVIGKKAVIEEAPMQPGDVLRTSAEITKAQDLLDYAPQFPLEKGLERFHDWYLENSAKPAS